MASPSVFISYSHQDEEWKDRLVSHLAVLSQQGFLELWDDQRIKAGQDWYQAIQRAMERASVAILLISKHFLTSEFILREEVRHLIERREQEELPVFPIIVAPCDWEAVAWLREMQVRPTDGRPLSRGRRHQIDAELAEIAKEVRSVVACSAPSSRVTGPKDVSAREDLRPCSSDEIRILVVDDDESHCGFVQVALGQEFLIESVSDPTRIEAQLREKPYHVLILDYVIPGLSSEQVLDWAREHQPDASIIVMTGYPSMDSALNCLRARTYDYLTKPCQADQLQRVVKRCLESRGLLRLSEADLLKSLGAGIRERRKALGLTLREMAERTGVTLNSLSQIELGKNWASIETLYRISVGLGVKMADLFQAVPPKL